MGAHSNGHTTADSGTPSPQAGRGQGEGPSRLFDVIAATLGSGHLRPRSRPRWRADQAGVARSRLLQAEARRQRREALRGLQVPLDDRCEAGRAARRRPRSRTSRISSSAHAGQKTVIGRAIRACSLDEMAEPAQRAQGRHVTSSGRGRMRPRSWRNTVRSGGAATASSPASLVLPRSTAAPI